MIPVQQSVQRLGIGLAALGRPAYINLGRTGVLPAQRTPRAMRDLTRTVLDAAYERGIRWVDAARSYGSAEEFLASWLRERGHEDVSVSSKWGYAYVADWQLETEVHEIKEHSVERLRMQWMETRKLLGDRVDLYQVHSLTTDSPLFDDLALQYELARIRDSGVRIGFSTSGAAQPETIERAWGLAGAGEGSPGHRAAGGGRAGRPAGGGAPARRGHGRHRDRPRAAAEVGRRRADRSGQHRATGLELGGLPGGAERCGPGSAAQ